MNKYGSISSTMNKYNLTYNNNYFSEEISKSNSSGSSLSYYDIKNIIRNEFAELIIPYQKQLNNYDNIIQQKIDTVESNLKGIIDSKSFDNMNHTAQMINMVMKNSNFGNNNGQNMVNNNNKNNLENKLNLMLKNQYDNKIDVMERQISSMNSLLKTFKETFDSNMLDIFKKEDYKKTYTEKSEYEKYKNEINSDIRKIKEEQKKLNAMNETLEKLFKNINELTVQSDNNNNNFLNEINSLKNNFGNMDEILTDLEGKLNINQLDKLKQINLESLKSINIYEINEMKEKIKSMNDNVDDLYEKLKNNDKNINNINIKYNELEQNLNYINKDVEFLNKQNLIEKIEEINKKLEDSVIKNKSVSNQNENLIKESSNKNQENNDNIKESNNEEIENENIFGLKGSRRQRRNLTKVENNSKIKNSNLNFDFDNIKKQLDDLSNQNKMLISKIETNNNNFMNINEQENLLNQKLDELNKKVKETENRLYLLELKNFGNVNENNNEEIKEDKSPFMPVNKNSINNSNINNNERDSKMADNIRTNSDINLKNLEYLILENSNIKINKTKADELNEKIMKEEKNNYKEKVSFGLSKEDKSYKDISISSAINNILDENKNKKSIENNQKLNEEKAKDKINEIDNYDDDFDDN